MFAFELVWPALQTLMRNRLCHQETEIGATDFTNAALDVWNRAPVRKRVANGLRHTVAKEHLLWL